MVYISLLVSFKIINTRWTDVLLDCYSRITSKMTTYYRVGGSTIIRLMFVVKRPVRDIASIKWIGVLSCISI